MKRLKIAVRHMVVTCVRSCVAAVALCLGALHAGAGVSIEGNTMLNGDTDYRGQGTVTIAADATLDLNGHNLWVDALAGAGHITDSKYYESLDYVQANGDQSVTTDYTPGVGTKIEVDFSPEANDGKPHALYATGSWSTYQFLCMVNAGGFYFFGKGGPNLKIVDGTRYCSILENGTISLVQQADGVKIGDAQVDQSYSGGNSLVFFDTPQTSGFRGHYKLYGVRVWHNGDPRLDLVPMRQSDTGTVGLFNRLNGDFFASDTGTSLVAGTATGAMLGCGSLRVAATDGASLSGFVGTVDRQVRRFIEGNTVLNGDTDYRGQGTVTIAADATLDLNGHNLWVDALAGAGHITDSKYYESLDYVQANGDQSVTTDYTPGVGTKIEVDFSPEANDGKPHALYATGTWGTYQFLCMVNAGGFYFFGKGGPNLKVVDGTRYCSILENGTISLVQQADGVKIGDAQVDQSYAGDNSLVFFDTPQTAGFRGHYKLYGARVWHNGEPRLDLVPVRQAGTEAVGLFNRLNGDFFASNTGTSLIAGTATGAMLGRGSLRVAAMDGVPLFGFVGTVDHQVRKFVDGDFTLSGDADWSAFGEYSLCGSVDLNGHKLTVNSLTGDATITSTADAGYDLLEYVDSDGNAYVDTGVTVADDTVIDIKVRMLKDPGNNYVSYVGARDQNARIGQLGGWFYSLNHYQGVTHPEELLGPAALNTDYTVHLDKSGPCTIDGEPFATGSGSGNGYTITIFGMNQEGGVSFKGSFRVYSCCIAYGTEVQCGLKPARRRSDGAVGFLNVNAPSKFYANVGSGALIAGPVVSEEYAKQPAELHVNVANGQTTENTGIAITGPVRVIKEGAGTLVATKAGQSFTCGLFVEGGTFKCGNVGSAYVYGPNGGMVTVRTGATFDCDGWWNHYGHHFVLDGGTIKSQNNRATARQAWFADVALTKDSFWYGCNYGFIGSDWGPCRLQMNAHTLTVDVTNGGDFFAGNLTVEGGGEIYMRTGGWFGIGGMSVGGQSTRNTYFKAEATTLRMGGAAFEDFGGEHVLGSYISEYTGNHDRASTVVKVLNRFVPGEKWHSTELQDGATLDLSAYASTWNTTCEFTSSVTTGTATFAEGATIYLELGERKVDVSEPIITWSEKPTHVKFRAAQESGLRFSVKSDGLYVSQGFGIIIR